ncbi:hypothetical protein F5Y07DRAFT_396416 [Xylaria sp. FL0933]|nr:hypothetical protein F5Y07DRAFT_396416 [Xylaria sp. FL0933]
MGKTAAASSGTTAPRDVAESKHKSKKPKSDSQNNVNKQQEANLAGIGAQFWQDKETQNPSSSGNYPKKFTLDE